MGFIWCLNQIWFKLGLLVCGLVRKCQLVFMKKSFELSFYCLLEIVSLFCRVLLTRLDTYCFVPIFFLKFVQKLWNFLRFSQWKNKFHSNSFIGWSFAFEDYFEMNITNKLDDPRFDSLMEIIDPFSYRDKILMPKLVIDGTMDEFFLLDDSSYWWNQMPNAYELNRFLMVPNAEHTQITGIFLIKINQLLKRIHLRSFVTQNVFQNIRGFL